MSSVNRRTILLVVWLAVLGGLYIAVTHINVMGGGTEKPPPPPPPPKCDAACFGSHWPQIMAHAVAPPRGPARAPYTLAEFGDFQCPQCGKMFPVIERMLAESHGKANLIFLDRPFPSIHKWAVPSAEAGLAAAAQGKFWPMFDILYTHQDDLEPGYYADYADQAGLNVARFKAAMASHTYYPLLKKQTAFDDTLDVEETPTMLVRDNATGKVTLYLGANSDLVGATPGFQGILQLAAAPPWGHAKA